MHTISGWTVASLAAAITLALGITPAHASVGLRQLPGQGTVVAGHVAAGLPSSGTQAITIGNATDTGPASAVINWGSGTDINPTGTAGFNLGSSAHLTFNDGTGGQGAAVLNIDSTGNPSQIFGQLTGNGTSIFVANPNGIIVGSTARISSTANVGLIGNTLTSSGNFDGTAGSIAYTGTGGDVTVARGARVSGTTVLVAGGGNVNVDLSAFTGATGSTTLNAGVASANAGAGSADNSAAVLTTAGALPSGRRLAGFGSAGSALNTGTLTLGAYRVDGLFTNKGRLTLPATNGAIWNQGTLTSGKNATFSSLVNDGHLAGSSSIKVIRGDLVNNGTITGAPWINVIDGSITNTGQMLGVKYLSTQSDGFWQPGADYSVTNRGTISSNVELTIDANRTNHYLDQANTSTGSLVNTGTLQLAKGTNLQVKGWQDVYLGGKVQTGSGSTAQDVSASNPIRELISSAGGYNATDDTPTFWNDGVLTIATPLAVDGAIIHGRQVKILSDVLGVDSTGAPSGNLTIVAGSQMANDYAVTIGDGVTVSGHMISIKGPTYTVAPTDGRVTNPNVLLGGTLSATLIYLGDAGQPLSDVYSDPSGGLIFTSTVPRLTVAFTGTVGALPSPGLDFRHAYLPATVQRNVPLALALKPVAYNKASGSVNLLVSGSVNLVPPVYLNSPAIYGNGTAPVAANLPNTHLVLQASGNIGGASGRFYWPGYMYLGTVAKNADGSAAPATLGSGTISLGGPLSNVLPGSIDGGAGIEFATANPLALHGYTVTTNANSTISFGTDALTQQYANGTLGAGAFFGGTQNGDQVMYGALDPSMFTTDTPPAAQ
ncbi:beta strand repeat-containing protein [Frateuria terrea]|uniref:Filamentous hemagglutinin family N-terminal domain-containing protein n=1 Tax=Frateuria terrea TaxID=529704 RepID=A0A1H6Y5D3_9GAMM|nr:filamentous hemagglutinin N-terminal domain-containing protein [Frateuria terrea]SEJ36479.1 filamentous hemagglutinin family N-terminal domain-containing protein [Frateuria terrea]SFP48795.1 filamentous hemagglutinin family N-terminal domain-containing protein [Frateuria terrea]